MFIAKDQQTYSQVDYAHLAEKIGLSEIAAEVFNCALPDSGNMETLARFGSDEQRQTYLLPLLTGDVKSGFAMSEPAVASSDATNFISHAEPNKLGWILNGEKTWIAGAGDPRFSFMLVMCVTEPKAAAEKRQSLLVVPRMSHGVTVTRMMPVFGYDNAPHGYAQIKFDQVQVANSSFVGAPGKGLRSPRIEWVLVAYISVCSRLVRPREP